jgi:hypothetical protein
MVYIVLFSAAAFALSFILNAFFLNSFDLNPYVSLFFIPSGVRIFLTLVFDIPGAIGIVLGSLVVSLFYLNQTSIDIALCMALVAGGAAMASRWLSVKILNLDSDLLRISFLEVLQVCFIFSAVNAISHQALFLALDMTDDFISQTLSMFAGDVTGALACLIFTRYSVLMLRRGRY